MDGVKVRPFSAQDRGSRRHLGWRCPCEERTLEAFPPSHATWRTNTGRLPVHRFAHDPIRRGTLVLDGFDGFSVGRRGPCKRPVAKLRRHQRSKARPILCLFVAPNVPSDNHSSASCPIKFGPLVAHCQSSPIALPTGVSGYVWPRLGDLGNEHYSAEQFRVARRELRKRCIEPIWQAALRGPTRGHAQAIYG